MSPTPAFQRQWKPFASGGMVLAVPPDRLPPGKYSLLQNVRSDVLGSLHARPGLTAVFAGGLGAAIHSTFRLTDPTPFASAPFLRLLGVGSALYAGTTAFSSIDTGWSGDPLTAVAVTPPLSPQPWLYLVDRSRMQKLNTSGSGSLAAIGMVPPNVPPSAVVSQPQTTVVSAMDAVGPWVAAGSVAGAPSASSRVNTTISHILYDSGTTGWALIAPAAITNMAPGELLTLASAETVVIDEVLPPIATTTIAAILYDSGSTGLCTIQPTGSLGTGLVVAPSPANQRYLTPGVAVPRGTVGTPPAPPNVTAHSVSPDFPVNSLVSINGEYVRIRSVTVGANGIQSFRCSTTGTHSAGETITGTTAIRCYCTTTRANGDAITASFLTNTLTTANTAFVGGIKATLSANLAVVGGTATLPEDRIEVAVNISDLTQVTEIRLYLDVDASPGSYTQNYYLAVWEANDLIAAIQSSNAALVSTVIGTQLSTQIPQAVARNPNATTPTPTTGQLALGSNQWLTLTCRVADLLRIGTDTSRTLANVGAVEILISSSGTSNLTVGYDDIYLRGGGGLDVASDGIPYAYCYRGRSSTTGAVSNPSPPMRSGVVPHRGTVTVTGTQVSDPQCDTIDWYRYGGTLPEWHWLGSGSNGSPPTFSDTFTDSAISNAPGLELNNYQPWPTQDLPRSGTCNVAGTAVHGVSGAAFNTAWARGSQILINGVPCSLYASPTSTTQLYLNENAGSGTGVSFALPGPTLLGTFLPTWWGPFEGVYFACGPAGNNPNQVQWTNPNNPDTTAETNAVFVTGSASEPLVNGCLWDGRPFVFSSAQLYELDVDPSGTQSFRARSTACGRGLWSPWALAVGPLIYFLAADGIYQTAGGGPAECLSADLAPIFPHDGIAGVTTNGVVPPDLTQPTRLRLTYVDGYLYFDYVDTNGADHTLVYDTRPQQTGWGLDVSTPGIRSRNEEPGEGVHAVTVGGSDGILYTMGGALDGTTGIACHVQIPTDWEDPRRLKLVRDAWLLATLNTVPLTVQLTFNGSIAAPAQILSGGASAAPFILDCYPGTGIWARDLLWDLTWTTTSAGSPVLTAWDVAAELGPEAAQSWLSGPTTHGLTGYQTLFQAWIAYLSSVGLTLLVTADGVTTAYAVPSSGGIYAKVPIQLGVTKGKAFQYALTCGSPGAQVFAEDCELLVRSWGDTGPYQHARLV